MKMNRAEIEKHCFYIVEEGFQILPPNSATDFLTVSKGEGVKINDLIYCTQEWYKSLFDKITG